MPTPLDALSYAKRFIGNLPVDDPSLKYRILNYAHSRLWMAAPWTWTVGSIPVVTLTEGAQDYPVSLSDFFSLVHVKWDNGDDKNDLQIVAALPQTVAVTGKPSQVAWTNSPASGLRVLPVPVGITGTAPKVFGLYKRIVTPITVANEASDYSTTFGIPQEWFWVYEELVLLRALMFAHSQRVGSVQTNGTAVAYTGQYGAVEAALAEMRKGEEKFLTTLGGEVTNG